MSLYDEFHGWFTLWQAETEDFDERVVFQRKTELIELMSRMDWLAGASDVFRLNSESYLRLHGTVELSNERRADIDSILDLISARLGGSHGLLYERFEPEDVPAPDEPSAFRVRVMTQGVVQVRPDPFFSHV
jgi:hypothetical protein